MYNVVDAIRGNSVDSQWDDFDDAAARCLELAEEQAGEDIEVAFFENGFRKPDGSGQWEAGACPDGNDGAYWPHVEFAK